MKTLRNIMLVLGIVCGLTVSVTSTFVGADSSVLNQACDNNGDNALCKQANGTGTNQILTIINKIVNVLMYILGSISVLMIVIGGIRYAVSAGNSEQVTAAKNTIMYAVIGLVVAIAGYAIVNFVLQTFL